MTKPIDAIIEALIEREGDYVDHPKDRGGPTRWGITLAVARAAGWRGEMRVFPITLARTIYWDRFVKAQGIDLLLARCPAIAAEALDTGVNMGAPWGVMFLQIALNAFNRQGKDWDDLEKVDGVYGAKSDAALAACLRVRAARKGSQDPDPVAVLLAAMNGQQCARYLSIIASRPSQEAFAWGWIAQRVLAPA